MSGLKIAVTLILIVVALPQRPASVRATTEPPDGAPYRGPPARTLPAAIRDRLMLTLRDAQASLRREWADEIAALDAARWHRLVMADRHSDAMFSSHGPRRD